MKGGGKRILPSSSSSSSSTTSGSKKLECSSSRVYKKRAKKEHENVVDDDIISNLPEHILHHIFSFLDMKQAIQTTCLLSKRWTHFWVSLPTLKFTYMRGKGYRTKANRNEFMDIVDRVLMIRGNSNIHEFVFVNLNNINVTDRLNTWILACVLRNVQQLTFTTYFPEKFHFHHCLFTCKSLTKLVVKAFSARFSLSLPDSITLPRLKTLSLDSVTFKGDEKVMDHLFSSCPVLESLIMKSCYFPHDNIHISSPQLQHLVLRCCRPRKYLLDSNHSDIKFKLCAPNLISFHHYDAMSTCCDLKNLCSLVKADINVYARYEWSKEKKAMYSPHMVNILREIHNVEVLTLSTSFLEVITGAPDLLDSQPTKFCNLRRLTLKGTWLSQGSIPAISYLLKISPNIETLVILDSDRAGNAATDLLDVQPTHFCNLRCLKIHTLFSRGWIYAMACLLKICPNTETLSYTLYHKEDYSSCNENNPYCDEIYSDPVIKKDYWKTVLSLECLLGLKCFELHDVKGRINELEFLEILLKNAMVLDKLLIVFKTTYSDTSGRHINFNEKVYAVNHGNTWILSVVSFDSQINIVLLVEKPHSFCNVISVAWNWI